METHSKTRFVTDTNCNEPLYELDSPDRKPKAQCRFTDAEQPKNELDGVVVVELVGNRVVGQLFFQKNWIALVSKPRVWESIRIPDTRKTPYWEFQ